MQGEKALVMPILAKISQAANARKLSLNEILSKHKSTYSLAVPRSSFNLEIRNVINLTSTEQDQLERAYESKEEQGHIDYISFCEDVRMQTMS